MLRVKGKLIREMHDNYVVIGLETTGLSPRYDNIIEFVGIKVSKGKIIDELSLLIKPFYPVSSFISKFTGITNEMLEDKPAITKLPKKSIPSNGKELGLINAVNNNPIIGNKIFSSLETARGGFILISLSFFVVRSFIIGG